jgi:hypothetical protein
MDHSRFDDVAAASLRERVADAAVRVRLRGHHGSLLFGQLVTATVEYAVVTPQVMCHVEQLLSWEMPRTPTTFVRAELL